MRCPVCGEPEARGECARCGTDLSALLAEGGQARLQVSPVRPTQAGRTHKA